MLPRRPTKTAVAAAEGWALYDVQCGCRPSGWSGEEVADEPGLVFVRHGRFARRAAGQEELVDCASAYFEPVGMPQQFRHEDVHGDRCTYVRLSAEAVAPFGDPDGLPVVPVVVDPLIALHHRIALSAAARDDPGFAATEAVLALVAAVMCRGQTRDHWAQRPSHRRLARAARELLAAEPASCTSLAAVARRLGVSPWHLSRVFAREHGVTVTAFRTRLRLRVAIDRLADGEADIAGLASDLGFADHAHLTRTMRAHTGMTPRVVRATLRLPRHREGCDCSSDTG